MAYKIKTKKVKEKKFRFIEVPSGKYIYGYGKTRRKAYNKLIKKIHKS
jgi:hypothetical protein